MRFPFAALGLLTSISLGHASSTEPANIVGGSPTAADPAVVAILAFNDQQQIFAICSGTLITPTAVLTAAHCVDADVGAAGYVIYAGTTVVTDPDPGRMYLEAVAADRAVHHPKWTGALEDGFDVAVIRLDKPATAIAPIPFNRRPLVDSDRGATLRLVGWGKTSDTGEDEGLKRVATSVLEDFDDRFMIVGTSSPNICNGDSGGPALAKIGGVDVVVGVASFGVGGCGDLGVSVRTDAYVPFIEQAAGIAPSPPPPPQDDQPDAEPDETDTDDRGVPTPKHDDETVGCSVGGASAGGLLPLALVGSLLLRRRRQTKGLLAVLVIALACTGCPSDEPGTVITACERMDECNALRAGVSTTECVESVDNNLDSLTSSQRRDWEGLMNACLDFQSCSLFLDCVERSDL